jgi:AbiV family abortive infection protein
MENRSLLNISSKECLEVYQEVLLNAERLWQTGETLKEAGVYSQAISSSIISIEELIKALVLVLDGSGFEFRNAKGVGRFFTDHKIRHFTAFLLSGLYVFGDDALTFFLAAKKNPLKLLSLTALMKLDREQFDLKVKAYFQKRLGFLLEELDWFADMEKMRQNGFYYDYANNPLTIDESKYMETIEKLQRVRKAGLLLINSYSKIESENMDAFKGMLKSLKQNEIYKHLSTAILKTGKNKADPFVENH